MPKVTSARHNALAEDYSPVVPYKQKAPKKRKRLAEDDESQKYIDTKASRRILQIGQELEDEDAAERAAARPPITTNAAFEYESRFGGDVVSEEDDEAEDPKWDDGDEAWGDEEEEEVEVEEVDPNDLDLFNRFMPSANDPSNLSFGGAAVDSLNGTNGESTNLADLILEKIAQYEAAEGAAAGRAVQEPEIEEAVELPPKVVETYSIMAGLLARYRSGKLPKAFKILPTLPLATLLAILPITRPEQWSPNAIYAATRLFVSSKSPISQGFLSNVLLERVRDDIQESRKLNVHLYNSIKKSLFKPKDFFKGFLFPLLSSGTATLREAHIISSVLTRVSIPVIHSAVALAKLCEIAAEQMSMDTEAAGATNIFIRTLLEKKYALPYQTIDALVFHFLRFRTAAATLAAEAERRGDMDVDATNGGTFSGALGDAMAARAAIRGRLPVLWHQCFLAFAQRYKDAITEDQREALLDLLLEKGHRDIGPEIRRELLAGRGRGNVAHDAEAAPGEGGDDTMMEMGA